MLLLRRYGRLLEEKPLTTKSITSFITFGIGDMICQKIEINLNKNKHWDKARTVRQASYGVFITPYLHFQFCFVMPYLFPGKSFLSRIKSVIFNQAVGAVITTSTFFIFNDTFSGKSLNDIKLNLKLKLLPTLKANWCVWPFLMFINFSFIPIPWMPLYSNICGMFWSIYLSYVQNVKRDFPSSF
jgi:protein Mpv17